MRAALVAVLLALPAAGCLEAAGHEVVGGVEVHDGHTIVLREGRLEVPAGARYELLGGTLALHDDPDVTVDGVVDVRGAFVARGATLRNVFRLTVHPGATLLLEDVTLEGGGIPAAIEIRSPDAAIVGGTLHVRTILVGASARIEGARLVGEAALPVVVWRDSAATFVGNVVEAPGHGVVLDGADGEVRGNTVVAGADGTSVAIAVRGGDVRVVGNAVTGAVGIALDGARGEVADNVVTDAAEAGLALVASPATVEGNRVEGGGRAGIYLKDSAARVTGNTITGIGDGTALAVEDWGAGVAVDGGAPVVTGNVVSGNDVGVAVLRGGATVTGNDIAGNRRFGLAVLDDVAAVDATDNWWGAPSGPFPALTETVPELPNALGADRVDPRARWQPWSATPKVGR